MAIGTNNRNDYLGSGATATYPYTFKILADTDLLVSQRDTDGNETVVSFPGGYSVVGVGDANGGSITLTANLPNGYTLSIRRNRPFTQDIILRDQRAFFAAEHETTFDHVVMLAQQLKDLVDRCVKLNETEFRSDMILPLARAGRFFAFDAGSVPSMSNGTGADIGLRQDLADSGIGDLLVAFLQSGTGAILRTSREKSRERVTPLDFGAIANGVFDCTTAIRRANAYLSSIGGGELYFPKGTYRITDQIEIPADVRWLGEGRGSSHITVPSTFTSASQFAFLLNSRCALRRLHFVGEDVAWTQGGGIVFLDGSTGIIIEENEIEKWKGFGIDTGGPTGTSGWIVQHNYVHHTHGGGIFAPANSEGKILNNEFGFTGVNGIDVNGVNVQVKDNFVYSCGFGTDPGLPVFPNDRNGIFLYPIGNGVNHQCEGNTVRTCAAHGIGLFTGFAGTNSQFIRVAHNTVFQNGTGGVGDGIHMEDTPAVGTMSDHQIHGNISYGNQGRGIGFSGGGAAARIIIKHNYAYANVGGDYSFAGDYIDVGNLSDVDPTFVERFSRGIQVGSSGAKIPTIFEAEADLTGGSAPVAVVGGASSFQTFTVLGTLLGRDYVLGDPIGVASVPGLPLVRCLVNGDNSVEIAWINTTGGNLTPTAGTYKFLVLRIG